MKDSVTRQEKGKWFDELLRAQEKIGKEISEQYVGKTVRVLCDDYGRVDGKMAGHTDGTAVIEFDGDERDLGKFITLKVEKLTTVLEGTRLGE